MKLTASQEQFFVKQARTNPEYFGKLFEAYYDQIFNYSLKRLMDSQAAADIASVVFFKAYKKLWQYKYRGLPFVAWLYTIAGNEIKNYYRDQKKFQVSTDYLKSEFGYEFQDSTDLEQELVEAQEKIDQKRLLQLVTKSLSTLKPDYQEVLSLRFFQNLKIKDISAITGKKEGTIKSLISRGVANLRTKLTGEDSGQLKGAKLLQQLSLKSVMNIKDK